jgi:hypothetical protein
MARIEITIPGERVVEDFTALVKRTVTPSTAKPANIGLVEISQSQPTELIPGPVGPQGPRGSRWYTGDGEPPASGPYLLGDMYVDDISGDVWTWDGAQWTNTGTNIQGSPDTGPQILAKLAPVDGAGSGLDADTLDGHDSTYFATDADMTAAENGIVALDSRVDVLEADTVNWGEIQGKPATFPPTLPIPSSGVTGLDAKQASQDTAINLRLTDANSDGLVYGRKNGAWSTVIGGAHTDDLPPPPPLQDGQLWWKSNTGNMFIWFDDGNSSQWVQIAGTLESPYPVARATALPRNRVVNGAMQISQENGFGSGQTTTVSYPADQWMLGFSGGPAGQNGRATASNPNYVSVGVAATTAGAPAASEYEFVQQTIEGSAIADVMGGTASAKPMVLRFEACTSAVASFKASVAIRAASSPMVSFVKNFDVVSSEWREFVIPIPACPGGNAWPTGNVSGLYLAFVPRVGSTFQAPSGEGIWATGSYLGTAQNGNIAATANAYLNIRNVGLYVDPDNTGAAPPWQLPDEAEELAACMRYYEKSYNMSILPGGVGGNNLFTASSGTIMRASSPFLVRKRAIPTGTVYNSTTGTAGQIRGANSTDIACTVSPAETFLSLTASTGVVDQVTYSWHWVATARML